MFRNLRSISRYFRSPLIIIIAIFFVPQRAFATYSAVMLQSSNLVIGSDSRQTSYNGVDVDDNVCKIIVLNDQTAFTLVGERDYRIRGTDRIIDTVDLVKNFHSAAGDDLQTWTSKFADDLVKLLNITPLVSYIFPPPGPVEKIIFASINDTGPVLVTISIKYNLEKALFTYDMLNTEHEIGRLFSLTIPNFAERIFKAADTEKKISAFSRLPEPTLSAYKISIVIKQIIDSHYAPNIGGSPSVLVMQSHGKPYWFSKAPSCLDIK